MIEVKPTKGCYNLTRTSKKTASKKNSVLLVEETSIKMDIDVVLTLIDSEIPKFTGTTLKNVAEASRDPFRVLISCIISLRTKDEVTSKAAKRLFEQADTPEKMANLPSEKIAELIYPAGFYKTKAENIKELSKELVAKYHSIVPKTIEELLIFKGVGRKTANLVVTLGYNLPGICVDTHVTRITQRIGYVPVKKYDEDNAPIFHSPDEVEMFLRKHLPKKWWIPVNDMLVTFGQNVCVPVSPKCSTCILNNNEYFQCPKIGVTKHR